MLDSVGTLLGCALLLPLVFWLMYQWSYRELIRQASKLPTVKPRWPFFGHIFYSLGGLEEITSFLMWQIDEGIRKGYEQLVFWVGPVPMIIIHKAEDIKKLLNSSSSLSKGIEHETYFKRFLDQGLLTATSEHWKSTRRHMNPLFHPRNIEHMLPVFNDNCRELVGHVERHVNAPPFNAISPLMNMGLKAVSQLIFGLDTKIDIHSKEFQGIIKIIEWLPEVFINRLIRLWLRSDLIFNLVYRKELKEMDLAMQAYTEAPLKRAKETYELSKKRANLQKSNDVENEHVENEDPVTLIGVYAWMQENLPQVTDRSLRDEMLTLAVTGTDTMGVGMASCLLALGYHQDIQDKVYEEIKSEIPGDRDVTADDLKSLRYMEQVLKETLRFFTIVPFLSRRSTEDFRLGECVVPKQTSMFLAIAALHMDPKTFPEPHRFNPERFDPEHATEIDRYSFIPFSGGPRNCIGKNYSYTLMKVALVHLLRSYRFCTSMDIHNLKKKFVVTMVNIDGYYVSITRR